jgi:nucleoside-diphosphate-sugar epimerase
VDVKAVAQKATVLVLGAGGFIGRRIMAALAASGWARPLAASRNIARADFEPGVERVALDATDPALLAPVLSGVEAVVSCMTGSARDIVASGTALLGTAARLPRPPRVVYLSSMAAYGTARGPVDESAPLHGDLGDYSAAKAAVDREAAQHPFTVRLRPGIVYGPRSEWWSDRIARLLVTHRLGDLGVAGQGTCNLVHVDDVAQAAVRAITSERAGGEAFNLGSTHPPTWNEYFAAYSQALGFSPVRQISRARLCAELYLAGPLLKLLEKAMPRSSVVAAHPAIRPWLTGLCRHEIRLKVDKARDLLGMQWTPLSQGLTETARWFLDSERA